MEQISPKKDKNECISGPPTKKPRLEEVETGTKNSHSLPGPEIAMDSTFSLPPRLDFSLYTIVNGPKLGRAGGSGAPRVFLPLKSQRIYIATRDFNEGLTHPPSGPKCDFDSTFSPSKNA